MNQSLWNHRLNLYIDAVRDIELAVLVNRVFVFSLVILITPILLAFLYSPTIMPLPFIAAILVIVLTFAGTVISYAFVRSARQHRANLSKMIFYCGGELEDSNSSIMLYDRASNALMAEEPFVR